MKLIKEVVEELCKNVCSNYKIIDSNGKCYILQIKEENIPHILGLHKVSDIPKLQSLNSKHNKETARIINEIKYGKINNSTINTSNNLDGKKEVKSRVNNSYMLNTMISKGEFIADFDANKVKYGSTDIDACSLIYKLENGTSYHLFLQSKDKKIFYPVTFFVRNDDNYYKNQNSYKIVNVNKNSGGKKKKSKNKKKKKDVCKKLKH